MSQKKPTSEPLTAPLFLVQRLFCSVSLLPTSRTVVYGREAGDQVPVAAFSSRAAAEAHAAELEQQARREMSPFLFLDLGDLKYISSQPIAEWRRALKAVGLKIPTKKTFDDGFGGINWQAWYDGQVETLTDEQRQTLWQLCDQIKLYEVVAVAPEGQDDE